MTQQQQQHDDNIQQSKKVMMAWASNESVELEWKDDNEEIPQPISKQPTQPAPTAAATAVKKQVRFDESVNTTATIPSLPALPLTASTNSSNVNSNVNSKPMVLSKSDRKRLWYSRKDIQSIRAQITALNMSVTTSTKMKNISGRDHVSPLVETFEETDSWRGLEHVQQGALHQKLRHRTQTVQSVLCFHKDLGVTDPVLLGVFAASNSRDDCQRALERGKQDAREAYAIYYSLMQENTTSETSVAAQQQQEAAAATKENVVSVMDKLWQPTKHQQQPRNVSSSRGGERKPLMAQRWNLPLFSL